MKEYLAFFLSNTTVEELFDLLMHFNYCQSAGFTLEYLLNIHLKKGVKCTMSRPQNKHWSSSTQPLSRGWTNS